MDEVGVGSRQLRAMDAAVGVGFGGCAVDGVGCRHVVGDGDGVVTGRRGGWCVLAIGGGGGPVGEMRCSGRVSAVCKNAGVWNLCMSIGMGCKM